jgi:hypothetical protein
MQTWVVGLAVTAFLEWLLLVWLATVALVNRSRAAGWKTAAVAAQEELESLTKDLNSGWGQP